MLFCFATWRKSSTKYLELSFNRLQNGIWEYFNVMNHLFPKCHTFYCCICMWSCYCLNMDGETTEVVLIWSGLILYLHWKQFFEKSIKLYCIRTVKYSIQRFVLDILITILCMPLIHVTSICHSIVSFV